MTDLEKYEKVNKCESLEELAQTIESFSDENGMIKGRIRPFEANTMAAFCRSYCSSLHNTLTREFGIRQQAMYIIFYNK